MNSHDAKSIKEESVSSSRGVVLLIPMCYLHSMAWLRKLSGSTQYCSLNPCNSRPQRSVISLEPLTLGWKLLGIKEGNSQEEWSFVVLRRILVHTLLISTNYGT